MGQRALQRLAIGALAGFGLAVGATAARAADDGYQNVFTSVLTAVGVMSPDEAPEIDYRERAPLVLPPKQDLRQPEPPGAHRTAAWPQDPDVIARKKASEKSKLPIISNFEKHEDRPEAKTESLKYRAAQAPVEADPMGCTSSDHSDAHCRLSVQEMRKQDARYRADNPDVKDVVTAGQEPERLYLTQPPKGYLKATKTVKATTEAPEYRQDTSSPLSTLIQRPHEEDKDSANQ